METAKLFVNGRSQAIRLPKDCRFTGDEVYIKKMGEAVMIFPKDRAWETFVDGLNAFTPDIFSGDREDNSPSERDNL